MTEVPFVPRYVLVIVFFLMSVVSVRGAVTEYSNWTQSLSGLADDATYAWEDKWSCPGRTCM